MRNAPKRADARGEPARHFIRRGGYITSKAYCDNAKDNQRDGDKPFVNVKDFPQQFWQAREVLVPIQHLIQPQVDAGDGKLADGGGDEDFVQVFEDEIHGLEVFVRLFCRTVPAARVPGPGV